MCITDALFHSNSLDEKTDPQERFIQALDESHIGGDFRELLIKHFQNDWLRCFGSVSKLEDVLNQTTQVKTASEKCLAIVISQDIELSLAFEYYRSGVKTTNPRFYDFLIDVKNIYFQFSPSALYQAGMKEIAGNYYQFVCWLYGEDYCYSKAFFNDEALNEMSGQERAKYFWRFFELISLKFQTLDENQRINELIRISSSTDDYVGPLTNGLNFIRAWVEFDTQNQMLSSDLYDIFYGYHSHWEELKNLARDEVTGSSDITKHLRKWLDDFRYDCIKLSLINTDLTKASKDEIGVWVREVVGYLTHIDVGLTWDELKSNEFESFEKNKLYELCAEFSHVQMSKWIEWSIQDDFTKILGSKKNSFKQLSEYHGRWITAEHFELWKTIFLEELNRLNIEEQLIILSCTPPYTEDYYSEGFQWWFELFINLVDSDDFPKHLLPSWTCVALNSNIRDKALPYVDKSIGILRGELSAPDKTNDEIKDHHKHLSCLLPAIDKISIRKGLRHRLMLQRFSVTPYTNDKLALYSGALYQGHFYDWYTSFNNLVDELSCKLRNNDKEITQASSEQIEIDFYTAFSCELVEFFLSRLRLRKGEKANNDQYDNHQVTEQSIIWRKGYVNALKELGFDLGGKVHKTINFIKKSDPDEGVRELAGQCYKAVRRHAKSNPSVKDIKRSIVAAEWWLLLCQRQGLKEEVNEQEAIKTRRNLMRNP
ncbi:hypothetical protein [Shewanella sp. 10N.286.48.B5]|uniref:hypothetical protein n=1 Tax=Shewanella sp. 10N.286.48.B5 TaxID=1880834 RepID=UPI000C85B508|nr:hypothetical protein [Shewanella sp. 10N.286.48.B5]PMH88894.1 hypothetical protein BCU57_19215 [Shewanella sp. 10N.286.48.B5]